MKIQVTKADIREGFAGCASMCPVALAAKRAFGEDLKVGLDVIWITAGYKYVKLPDSAQLFIAVFDGTGRGEPFEFEVEAPE